MQITELVLIILGILLVFFLMFAFFMLLRIYVFFKRSGVDSEISPAGKYKILAITEVHQFNRKTPLWEKQTTVWRKAMRARGAALVSHQVRAVYLIHGTGIGHDPLGLLSLFATLYPKTNQGISRLAGYTYDSLKDRTLSDYGQFCQKSYLSWLKGGDLLHCDNG